MNESQYFDISPVISEKISVFPGDVGFKRTTSLHFDKGDNLVLSSIESTLHLGAHADGPVHYAKGEPGIGERDLSYYMGRCLVLHATASRGERIGRQHLSDRWQQVTDWGASRVLIRTGSFPDPNHWNGDFNSIESSFLEDLAGAGVRLIGIDTPSVDAEQDKVLRSHSVVARHDMAILEGLVLCGVAEGYYTLMALPLKIQGADASPVRAVLFRNPDLLATCGVEKA